MACLRCTAGSSARTALACLASGVALTAAADAATFTVTTSADAGAGSLRQAILDANAAAGADTIAFMLPPGSPVIVLASDLPELTGPVTIDASGAPGLQVDGDGAFVILRTGGVDAGVIDLGASDGEIQLGDGDTLTLTANADFEISAAIVDVSPPVPVTGGALLKDGPAVLTLSGNNTFTGGITIEAGTLVGDTNSLGTGDITNDGALVFDQDDDAGYAGVISGSGSLEKAGGGELTLTGANTYSGGTTVSAGVLIGDTTSLQGDIVNDAELVFDQAAAGAFAGDVTGEGSLTKRGAGNLTLTGSNDYDGGTTVEAGTLTGDTDAIRGDVELSGGNLVFDQPANGTFAGDIGGSGSVTKQGAGNLTLAGSNDYSGGTTVAGGTLTGDSDAIQGSVMLMAATTLVFDQPGSGSFAGLVSGPGAVVKQGGGTLTVTAGQAYSGPTTVAAGTLDLAGSLASPTTVQGNASLSGGGTIFAPLVLNGRLLPGGAGQDTFSVADDTDFGAGSRFVVDMDAADAGDRLDVAGNVDIDPGAVIEVRPAPGDYSAGSTVTVLTAGGVSGTFLESEPFAFLDRTVTYPGGNSVQVTLMENLANVATAGTTPNQLAVGGALSTLAGSPDPDITLLFDNLNTLTVSQVGATLDSLSGESLSALTTARVALGERMQRTLHRRMRSLLFSSDAAWPARPPGPGTRAPLGGARTTDVGASPRLGERGVGAWIDAFGVLGALDGDGNGADVDYGLLGTTAGLDLRVGNHGLVGAAAGYAYSDVQVDDRDAEGDANTAQGGLYAAWANRLAHVGVSGRYAWSRADHRRDVVAGSLRREARSDFDSHDYGVRGELALKALQGRRVVLEPLAGFEWSRLDREGFRESGAGSLGLDVDAETLDTALLQVGARLHGLFEVDEQSVLVPELRAYWLHEFGDDERRVDASLAGAPFVASGAEAPRDAGLLGLGWSLSLGPNVRATADYDVRLDADRLEHLAGVTVRGRF